MQKYMMETKRLGLRLLEKGDIHYLEELESDPMVKQFFPDGARSRDKTEAMIQKFITYYEEKGLPCFMLFELESGEFVGRSGFGVTETNEIEVSCIKNFGEKDMLQRL